MRAVSSRLSLILAAVAATAVVAACGDEVDLSRVTFDRTTVPAGEGTGPSNTVDRDAVNALTADTLRLVDPCYLLDVAVLDGFGAADENTAQDFHRCRNYMQDDDGESLNVSIRVGESMSSSELGSDEELGPYLLHESDVEGACFVTLVLDHLDPPLGVGIQTSYEASDPCEIGRAVAASVGDRLVSPDAVRSPDAGSLLDVDPCAVAGELPAQAVDGATEPDPYGLHDCEWRNDDGVAIELKLRGDRYDPGVAEEDRRGEEVDLGSGFTGYQVPTENLFPTCELAWLHLSHGEDRGELIAVDVRDVRDTGIDGCAAAVTFAKELIPLLPQP